MAAIAIPIDKLTTVMNVLATIRHINGTPHFTLARKILQTEYNIDVKRATISRYWHDPGNKKLIDWQWVKDHNENFWDEDKSQVSARLRDSIKRSFNRLHDILSNDEQFDARDVRNLAYANDVMVKSLALLSGDVTSRAQLSQTTKNVDEHIIRFELPQKNQAAFDMVDGLNVQDVEYETIEAPPAAPGEGTTQASGKDGDKSVS